MAHEEIKMEGVKRQIIKLRNKKTPEAKVRNKIWKNGNEM